MVVTAELVLAYGSEEEAARVHEAVARENEGYVEGGPAGRGLVYRARASDPLSLLRTLDDLLAAVGVAEDVLALG